MIQDMVKFVETGKIADVCCSGVPVNPIKGGAEVGIKDANWQYPVCTTGFIVKDPNGNYRGITAGHCMAGNHWNDGTQQYYQPNNGRYIGNQISG
jgi:hypothetical protein